MVFWFKKINFSFKMKKQLIIHADDAGLSQSENKATIFALKNGVVNSYSIMAPCAWSYKMALFAKENPQYDSGVHLTLTCEWNKDKFGPILSAKKVPSLVDKHGFFHKNRRLFLNHYSLDHVKMECKAQIEYLLTLGVNLTHIDSHMFTMGLSESLLDVYRLLGKEYNLPIFLNGNLMDLFTPNMSENLKESDFCLDHFIMGNIDVFQEGKLNSFYANSLLNLKKGVNIMLIHPAYNNDEMQGICIDHPNFGAEWRQIDLDFFTGDECVQILKAENIELITWKEIKSKF